MSTTDIVALEQISIASMIAQSGMVAVPSCVLIVLESPSMLGGRRGDETRRFYSI